MAFSGSQLTRQGLSGISRGILSFTAKEESSGVDVVFTGQLNDLTVQSNATKTIDYSGYFSNATSYSISPSVESGWSFNVSTGILTILEDAVAQYGSYVITGAGTGASADSNAFYVYSRAGSVGGNYGFTRKSIEEYEKEVSLLLKEEKAEALKEKKALKAKEKRLEIRIAK